MKLPMQGGKERNRFECTIYIVPLSCRKAVYVFIGTSNITKLFDIDNNVSETANLLGFEYVHHFNRIFKKVTGITPSSYMGK